MIRKGTLVRWKEGVNQISYGTVEETYEYKLTNKIKNDHFVRYNTAGKALYIKLANGQHVLRNDNEVELVD
ncbi:hypothetical protein [Aquimarina celericrescens]|uniref:Hypervirulence associated protein TUDOR domain-containing protein n=1 Tax=Aquimarina celericrescens TaxID=1964542 RepID=A0ABW5B154_9FLAO|nr:hypothetical protein [Aquimarina celericrescens]